MQAVPVIALTGYLGAGKTTMLNHVLRTPGARIGVVINDFGELNVDAGLVTGQVDEPASIAGGCICCLSDDDTLDDALTKLADPKLDLDAIIVEASGMADPVAISRIIRFSGAENVRWGGVVDVIDAHAHFDTVDHGGVPPARYGAASLVVVNKVDQIPDAERDATLERIETRVRQCNPDAQIVGVTAGRIDPTLLYDVSARREDPGQLSFRELMLDAAGAPAHAEDPDHLHADSVTVTSERCIDPDALFDLLENPPSGVYRLKGVVAVRYRASSRNYVVNLVGTSIHVAAAPAGTAANHLVAIGIHLDIDEVRARVHTALQPQPIPRPPAGSGVFSSTGGSAFDQPPPPVDLFHQAADFQHRQRAEHPLHRQTRGDRYLFDRPQPTRRQRLVHRPLAFGEPVQPRCRVLRLVGQLTTAPNDFHDLLCPCHQLAVLP